VQTARPRPLAICHSVIRCFVNLNHYPLFCGKDMNCKLKFSFLRCDAVLSSRYLLLFPMNRLPLTCSLKMEATRSKHCFPSTRLHSIAPPVVVVVMRNLLP
jgi:hypothetical protein